MEVGSASHSRLELGNGAGPHAAPVGIPAAVPAVDSDLALGGLVVRIGFDLSGVPVKDRTAIFHDLRVMEAEALSLMSDRFP